MPFNVNVIFNVIFTVNVNITTNVTVTSIDSSRFESLLLLVWLQNVGNTSRARVREGARGPASPERLLVSDDDRGRAPMQIIRNGSRPSGQGPADWFTGSVRLDPAFDSPEPARAVGVWVTFEPGARTAWHTHPLGQTLIITAGCGWVQRQGGPIEEIRPGDVVWFEPGEKHWHGATATTALTHLAIQEKLDGSAVEWLEKVSDEEYAVAGGES